MAVTDREHSCHADGCEVRVQPSMLMCRRHWFLVPKALRDQVWCAYVDGQEDRMNPTDEYLRVSGLAIQAVAEKERRS